jgi:hypothetical protein
MGATSFALIVILGIGGMAIGLVPFWVPAIAVVLLVITGIMGKS